MKARRRWRLNMYGKILLLCTSSILASLSLLAGLFFYNSAETIYEQSKQSNVIQLQRLQDDVTQFVQNVEDHLISIYNDSGLINDLVAHVDYNTLKNAHFRAAYALAQEFHAEDGVVAVYFYDDFDRLFSSYRHAATPTYHYPEDPLEETDGSEKVLRRFLREEMTTMLMSGYYNEYRDTMIVRFAINIFSQDGSHNQIGAVVCDMDSEVLVRILQNYRLQEDNLLWIQPAGDMVLAQTDRVIDQQAATAMEAIQNGVAGQELQTIIQGQVLFCMPLEAVSLAVYSLMPPTLLLKNQEAIVHSLTVIAILMLIVFAFVSHLFARGMTRPLGILTGTMRKIQEGDTELRVQNLGTDEIGELGSTFNHMLDRVETLLVQEYEMKLSLQRAQYNALQAQINPHFLYNTLDTMGSIAQIRGCDEVSDLSASLSQIFRYTLDMRSSFATVERELIHLKNYIYVMDVRMHSQIRFSFQVEERLLGCQIPKLTLQPLVENAIQHGVRHVRREKEIIVKISQETACMVLSVSDNGTGMDAQVLNSRLQNWTQAEVEAGKSIGLLNIHARVQTLYGPEYGLKAESIPEHGTTIYVRLPIQEVVHNDI